MASKPSIPKGTRDFSPSEVAKRQYIISIIKSNFEKFGFDAILMNYELRITNSKKNRFNQNRNS